MSFKLLAGIGFAFLTGTFLSVVFEGVYLGTDEVNLVNQLLGFRQDTVAGPGLLGVIRMGTAFFTNAIPKMALWDYAFWEGPWQGMRWLLFFTLSMPLIVMMALSLAGVVGGLFGQFLRR